MKRQPNRTNRQRLSSLDAGIKVDHLVKLRREKHGESITEALEAVSRTHPRLYKTTLSGSDRVSDVEEILAKFLNSGGNVEVRSRASTRSSRHEVLYSDIHPQAAFFRDLIAPPQFSYLTILC